MAASSPAATIGAWATTARPRTTARRAPLPPISSGTYSQIHRMGNPLVDDVLIGTGSKDLWSMSEPKNDSQFAGSYSDPELARIFNAIYGISIPPTPRVDLSPFYVYAPPIAAPGTAPGPVADMLRLNTAVAPTSQSTRRRLGLLAGDPAGFPNGRRVSDDVIDIFFRFTAGAGATGFNVAPNNRIGDGVNTNDVPYQETFPYVAWAQSGRQRRHIDPGEAGCTQGGGGPCPVN